MEHSNLIQGEETDGLRLKEGATDRKALIHFDELRGVTHLINDSVVHITHIAEELLHRIVHPPFLPSTPVQRLISGISSLTFRSIRFGSKSISRGLNRALHPVQAVIQTGMAQEKKEALLSIVNGVMGDHLQHSGNPLSIPMQIRYQGQALKLDADSISRAYPELNGKILFLIHGLCMNDHHWGQSEVNYGEDLAAELGMTPVYLTYNTGLHICENGALLNKTLQELVQAWPLPVESLNIIAFSMGGLVARSSLKQAEDSDTTWTAHLKKLIFLGTPHHGSPMERMGNQFHGFIRSLPYAKAFTRLGSIRSAGITDLRYGNLLVEDRRGKHRFDKNRDERNYLPLPGHVSCFAIAGSRTKALDNALLGLQGDGLVPVDSALGRHKDAAKSLGFEASNTYTEFDCTHLGLLNRRSILQIMKGWLLQ